MGVPVEQQANYSKAFEEKHKEASYMQLPFWSEEEMKEKMEEIRELNKKIKEQSRKRGCRGAPLF